MGMLPIGCLELVRRMGDVTKLGRQQVPQFVVEANEKGGTFRRGLPLHTCPMPSCAAERCTACWKACTSTSRPAACWRRSRSCAGSGRWRLLRAAEDRAGEALARDARPLQHRMQQHVAAGGDVLGLGVLDLVVADAVRYNNLCFATNDVSYCAVMG